MEEDAKAPPEENSPPKVAFKKPILVGKLGKFPRKFVEKPPPSKENEAASASHPVIVSLTPSDPEIPSDEPNTAETDNPVKSTPAQKSAEVTAPLPYKEPPWSGMPQSHGQSYKFEVLKNGVIISEINLMDKPFWVFGRLANCDVYMAHPTISRYHAIVQYRSEATADDPAGFYLYDLHSTHGTFLNKNRLQARQYVRLRVGHVVKLGCSSRSYILAGPEADEEAESALSVAELKQKRADELRRREEDALKAKMEEEARRRRVEERGVDWGLGEDAEEEPDLAENPFAQTNNEELYLDDPKKALRGFMEREGHNLDYDCREQGFGQFLCKVELPLDDEHGRPLIAEVLHKGKKKEAVVQCALEACRILDRHGLLRQATHESRKRKAKDWAENDFYDSDDDTFLDRTGVIEKKREKRMEAKQPAQPETYQTLLEKERKIVADIHSLERQLAESTSTHSDAADTDDDPLDSFMKGLQHQWCDKTLTKRLRADLIKLRADHAQIVKLVNVARPADLPPLQPHTSTGEGGAQKSCAVKSGALPIFGKRTKTKIQLPARETTTAMAANGNDEMEEDDEVEEKKEDNTPQPVEPDATTGRDYNSLLASYRTDVEPILLQLEGLMDQDSKISLEAKTIVAKGKKIRQHIDDLRDNYSSRSVIIICKEFERIFKDIEEVVIQRKEIDNKMKLSRTKLELLCGLMERARREEESAEEREEQRRRKNQRRIQQRQEKAKMEKEKGYKEDARKEDYNMWMPPKDQTGDGRTSLNDKFDY